jgi:hypothetical protein
VGILGRLVCRPDRASDLDTVAQDRVCSQLRQWLYNAPPSFSNGVRTSGCFPASLQTAILVFSFAVDTFLPIQCTAFAVTIGADPVRHYEKKQVTWRPQRQHKYSNKRTLTTSTSGEAHGWQHHIGKNWHNRAPASGEYTITLEDGRVRPKHVDD